MSAKRVMVVGGDGYCGWATALHLSKLGYDVAIYDNLIRRHWDATHHIETLTPIASIERRIAAWRALNGKTIALFIADTPSYKDLSATIGAFRPDTIVHFGEQRSAPFSMIDRRHALMIIDLRDTVACVELSIANPPEPGRLQIFNQFTEMFSVLELAERVQSVAQRRGLEATIEHVSNPRIEREEHDDNAKNTSLLALGLEPHLLDDVTISGMLNLAEHYRDRIDVALIAPTVQWRRD
jgi:nucleoside-diphosphate-sugar epimerase